MWLAIGTALAGLGGVLIAFAPLAFKVVGGVAIVFATYVFLHFFFPKRFPLPPPKRIRTLQPRVSSYPLWLSPYVPRRAAANMLLDEGRNILNLIPATTTTDPREALGRTLADGLSHEVQVAQWEERVAIFLSSRSSECTALFNRQLNLPRSGPPLRDYLQERLAELTTIHGRL